ncbi:hypothetical protein D3C81_1884020 [compost metagenome]
MEHRAYAIFSRSVKGSTCVVEMQQPPRNISRVPWYVENEFSSTKSRHWKGRLDELTVCFKHTQSPHDLSENIMLISLVYDLVIGSCFFGVDILLCVMGFFLMWWLVIA